MLILFLCVLFLGWRGFLFNNAHPCGSRGRWLREQLDGVPTVLFFGPSIAKESVSSINTTTTGVPSTTFLRSDHPISEGGEEGEEVDSLWLMGRRVHRFLGSRDFASLQDFVIRMVGDAQGLLKASILHLEPGGSPSTASHHPLSSQEALAMVLRSHREAWGLRQRQEKSTVDWVLADVSMEGQTWGMVHGDRDIADPSSVEFAQEVRSFRHSILAGMDADGVNSS